MASWPHTPRSPTCSLATRGAPKDGALGASKEGPPHVPSSPAWHCRGFPRRQRALTWSTAAVAWMFTLAATASSAASPHALTRSTGSKSMASVVIVAVLWSGLATAPAAAQGRQQATASRKPTIFLVGGSKGFTFNVLSTWKVPTVRVGDKLSFVAPNLNIGHDVWMMANEAAFRNCDFTGAKRLGGSSYTTPPFTKPGKYYYACGCCGGDFAHCMAQQKVAVTVLP